MLNKFTGYEKYAVIDSILEINLSIETWEKVKTIAEITHSSYSWVVRYALFRLIKKKNFMKFILNKQIIEKFEKVNAEAQRKGRCKNMHRHKLCLYGEDELFIRITAAQMNFSMTHLVRLSLEWYLDDILRAVLKNDRYSSSSKRHFDAAWYWLGIKHYCDVEIPNKSCKDLRVDLSAYPIYSYW